ncbi:MAG TPA: hypothetical protein DHW82_05970 [Spirochaetia bacterium]|nr:MAG: hypothetical protein A2Y41_11490 [Spirochaetes bacterium GWB1_36_13]HCL56540.1 hypothetical protein [Spirochaetia bacterium]
MSGKKKIFVFLLMIGILTLGCKKTTEITQTVQTTIVGSGFIEINGVNSGDPKERIFVRKVGIGSKTIVLLGGNNTSGEIFEPILSYFRGVESLNKAYTVYTFDYRGSGLSSYNKKITGLKDFALDFEKIFSSIQGFPSSGVTLVGYSMGFGVALEMVIANPSRYSNLVSLAGIGTRGVRVSFNAGTAGTDSLGHAYQNGDWVPVSNDDDGTAAAEFQQRAFQGENRTFENISYFWDMLVLNDVLKYNINTLTPAVTTFKSNYAYNSQILDLLTIQYMPESLYYCHKLNLSNSDITHTNTGYGGTITITGDGRLASKFSGINTLLVKAKTDFTNWRGDQVLYDNYTATTKYDLKQAGSTVTAVLINPDQNYDHGFPTVKPLETAKLLDTFLSGTLSASTASTALGGATVLFYDNSETAFETNTFTGY